MNRLKKVKFLFSIIALLSVFAGTLFVEAAEVMGNGGSEIKFKQAVANENKVKIYVRGADASEEATYQIGNYKADSLKAYGIAEDENPMRTLIMLDNSLSVPTESREKIKELLCGILDAHSEKEVFRLATFSDSVNYLSDTYSSDYTAMKNVIDSITYVNQETYLTDVLYDVIEDLNKDAYMGFTRIFIISDGVDNKQIGVTRDELNAKLTDTRYSVYTVGTFTGKNSEALENMFALSRITEAEYCVLEDTETSEMISVFSQDSSIEVFEALIPEDAKTGGKQSSMLTLSDGSQIVFSVNMPFTVKENSTEAAEEEEPEEEEPEKEEPVLEPEEEIVEEEEGLPVVLIIGGAAVAVILAAVILFFILRKKKAHLADNEEKEQTVPIEKVDTQFVDTVLDGEEDGGGIMPSPAQGNRMVYRVTFTDKQDIARTYRCELKKSITLGRESSNDVAIPIGTVSKKHCIITNKNGRFFILNLSETNGTYVDGGKINHETEIFSGNVIKMGKVQLVVKFERVQV